MNPDDFAVISDAFDQLVAMVSAYRAKLEAAGFSPTAAEAMTMQYHQLLIHQTMIVGKR